MDLGQIANIAEIVGVVLVIITLAFLTLQIRQNTQALRATTLQSAMQSEMKFASILLTDAAVWEKVVTGAPIASGEETRKSILLFNVFMTDTESRYHQFNAGNLDARAWSGRLGTMPEVVKLPTFKLWRNSLGGLSHSSDFLKLLDELAAEGFDESSN